MTYSGRCHCGALGFRYETAAPPAAWSVRACQCTFCRAHAARTTSDPHGSLAFLIADQLKLVRYRFGLRTAEFLLCACCGVYIGAAIATPRGRYGIVNVNALRPALAELPQPRAVVYENEDELQRMARREARWTPLKGSI
jgi:hypothetical protein